MSLCGHGIVLQKEELTLMCIVSDVLIIDTSTHLTA